MTFHFQPMLPGWLLFLLLTIMAACFLARSRRLNKLGALGHGLFLGLLCLTGFGMARVSYQGHAQHVVFLVDTSASIQMQHRWQRTKQLLLAADEWLKQNRPWSFTPIFRRFDQAMADGSVAALTGSEPRGKSTAIGMAIKSVLEDFPNPAAIILPSDGTQLTGVAPESWAEAAFRRHTPIYPIPLGAEDSAPDGAVTLSVHREITGRPGERLRLPVQVTVAGTAPREAMLTLAVEDRVVETASVTLSDNRGQKDFWITLPDAPFSLWTIALTPLPDETYLANNKTMAVIASQAPAATATLLAGRPSWEGSALIRALRDDPRWAVRAGRLITPDLHTLVNFPDATPFPLTPDVLTAPKAPIFILGEDWQKTTAPWTPDPGRTPCLLLAGAAFPGIHYGPWQTGTLSLTEAGRALPFLHGLAGRKAAGRGLQPAAGATPLVMLTPPGKAPVTVCMHDASRRLWTFSLRQCIPLDETHFFSELANQCLHGEADPPLKTDRLNYGTHHHAVVQGKAGLSFTLLKPEARKAQAIVMPESGRYTFTPETPGLYRLAIPGVFETLVCAQENQLEKRMRQPDHGRLAGIAALSGGRMLKPEAGELTALLDALNTTCHKTRTPSFQTAWDGWPWFAMLALLIGLVLFKGGARP